MGWVRFWECHAEGELVAQFNAGHQPGSGVIAICAARPLFDYLITGDTNGYIHVWYLPQYANSAALAEDRALPPHSERFQLLRESMIHRRLSVQHGRFAAPSAASNPARTWSAPLLVTAFRAHLSVVTSLDYVDDRDCFISAGDDCSLRMWTVYGLFVGIFGRETPWLPLEPPPSDDQSVSADMDRLSVSGTSISGSTAGEKCAASTGRVSAADSRHESVNEQESERVRRLPADVRPVASACTLRVLYGGHVPQWKATKAKMLAYIEVYQRVVAISNKRQRTKTADDDADTVRHRLTDLPSAEYSRILGTSYRRQRRYRPLPTVPRVLQNDLQSDVYSKLPFHETVPCSSKDIQLPAWASDVQSQRRRQQAAAVSGPRATRGVTASQQRRLSARRSSTLEPATWRRARTVGAKRQDCTFDASVSSRRVPVRRRGRAAAATGGV